MVTEFGQHSGAWMYSTEVKEVRYNCHLRQMESLSAQKAWRTSPLPSSPCRKWTWLAHSVGKTCPASVNGGILLRETHRCILLHASAASPIKRGRLFSPWLYTSAQAYALLKYMPCPRSSLACFWLGHCRLWEPIASITPSSQLWPPICEQGHLLSSVPLWTGSERPNHLTKKRSYERKKNQDCFISA